MRRSPRIGRGGVALALFAALLLPACSDGPGEPGANREPETGLVFVGDVDTTLYLQEIRWWGTDLDGAVVGFEYRWTTPDPVAGFDSSWIFTTDIRDTFALPTPTGHSSYTFHVRSVDDRGGKDATPAEQTYPFFNAAPSLRLLVVNDLDYPDTLFPSLTLKWFAKDPDGDETLARFLVWTEGNEADPIVVEGAGVRQVALSPDELGSGQKKVYVQAVDSGQRGSPPDSFSAFFLPSSGHVLLVDDLPDEQLAAGGSPDPSIGVRYADYLYYANLDTFYRQGRSEDFARIDLERYPVQSLGQAAGLLEEYDRIIWYDTISDSLPSPALGLVRDLLPDWLGRGGRMLVISSYVVGTGVIRFNPSLNRGDTIPEAFFPDQDPRFRRVTLGIDSQIRNRQTLAITYDLVGNADLGLENLRQRGGFVNATIDYFSLREGTIPLYTIPAGTEVRAGDTLEVDARVGLLHDSGAGRILLIGFPLSRMREGDKESVAFRRLLELMEEGP